MPDEKSYNKIGYNNKYNAEKYDRITVMLPKGYREKIRAAASECGLSATAFIKGAIDGQLSLCGTACAEDRDSAE